MNRSMPTVSYRPTWSFKLLIPRKLEDSLLLLAGTLLRVDVYIVGRLSAAELLLIAVLPLYFLGRKPMAHKVVSQFYAMITLFFLSILVSDFWNDTSTDLMIRGLARPVVIGLIFMTLIGIFQKNPRSIRFFFIGLLFSGIINVFYQTDSRAANLEFESYGYFAFVYTPLVFAIVSVGAWLIGQYSKLAASIFLILSAIFVSVDFSRTTMIVFFMSGLCGVFGTQISQAISRYYKRNGLVAQLLIFGLIGLIVTYFALGLYIQLAVDGAFGERVGNKVAMQIASPFEDPVLNMFIRGRHYNISNFLMIMDNPLFGTGSWPLEGPYVIRAIELLGDRTRLYDISILADRRGIGHSILLGTWANYGFQAAIFWFFCFFWAFRYLGLLLRSRDPLMWLMLCYILSFLISIFFNNLNSLNRVLAAMLPAALVFATIGKSAFHGSRLATYPAAYRARRA